MVIKAGAKLELKDEIVEAAQDRARPGFDIAFARFARPSSLQLMHRLGDAEEAR